MQHVEGVADIALRAAGTRSLIEGTERAALDHAAEFQRPLTFFGGDGDHTADGIRAVKAALWTSQYFNALDVAGEQVSEVECTIGDAWIANVNAVDQDLHMIGIGAADKHRGLSARPARLYNVESGHGAERLRHGAELTLFNILRGDERDRTSGFADRRRQRRRADDDRRQRDWIVLRLCT